MLPFQMKNHPEGWFFFLNGGIRTITEEMKLQAFVDTPLPIL